MTAQDKCPECGAGMDPFAPGPGESQTHDACGACGATVRRRFEGWMAEKPTTARRYHYIRETMALCRGFGFYTGELMPDTGGTPRRADDCMVCYRKLRAEQARRA